MKNTKIFLVGFMGCGKSTFGRQLAKAFEYAFIDMDTYIEERAGKTVPQIFEQDGEAHFRALEHQAIQDLSEQVHCVIATGGGAPCYHNNMHLMNELGVTIYLELAPANLAQRLQLDTTERPVLQGKTGEELVAFISDKLKERETYYLQATHSVDADRPELAIDILKG